MLDRARERSARALRSPVLWAALSVPAVGCGLTLVDPVQCTSHTDCRQTFSFGSVCGDDGLCVPPSFPRRCNRSFPFDLVTDPTPYRDHRLLGTLFSFEDHEDTLQAAELAVRQVNEEGGLDGQPFALLHCDYTPLAGDSMRDIEAVEALVPFLAEEVGVPAIIGPRGSDRTIAAFNAVRGDDVLVISPSATSPALTALEPVPASDDAPGLLWRTAPPDSRQGEVMARDLIERGITNAAVLMQSGAYGDGLASLFSARFSQGGGGVSLFAFDPGDDFSLQVAQIAEGIDAGRFEEVVVISSDIDDYVTFFQSATATASLEQTYGERLANNGFDGGIFLPDTGYSVQLLDAAAGQSAALFGIVRGSRPAPADGVVFNAFSAAYRSAYGEDSTGSAFTPHSYDAAWMVLYGAAWSQFNEASLNGVAIARGLRKLSAGPELDVLPDSWTAVVDAMRAGASVDLRGASGDLDFDAETEETVAPIEVWRIEADPSEPSGFGLVRIDVVDP